MTLWPFILQLRRQIVEWRANIRTSDIIMWFPIRNVITPIEQMIIDQMADDIK